MTTYALSGPWWPREMAEATKTPPEPGEAAGEFVARADAKKPAAPAVVPAPIVAGYRAIVEDPNERSSTSKRCGPTMPEPAAQAGNRSALRIESAATQRRRRAGRCRRQSAKQRRRPDSRRGPGDGASGGWFRRATIPADHHEQVIPEPGLTAAAGLLKFGVGRDVEITGDEVRERIKWMVEAINAAYPPAEAEKILDLVEEAWTRQREGR